MNNQVKQIKLRLGLIYGMVAGFAFALFAWGVDAILLARASSSYYWTKFVPGLLLAVIVGGIVGWLTVLIHKHGFALLFWGLMALLLSWLVVWLPFSGTPLVIKLLNPTLASLIRYSAIQDGNQLHLVSLVIVGVVAVICGLLELNLIDQAILSSYVSGKVLALAVCFILFGIAGSATDHMINTGLREPVQIIDELLQFAQENAGVEVPKAKARQMHLSATNQLGAFIQKSRRLTLISIDENMVMMDVLVDFNGAKAKCSTIFSQPTDCIILTSNP